ncbi:uncharacterized protein LOC119568967 [Penaeus monodon]|uniref:uncharacterized protein LOC119568967 n=1 Tax=Penaeus monodon TaxID=6687 RepID=UPI0018A6EEC8|nr:uncharacterized protein LOC119568967 [Penaeus monodon]
MGAVLLHDPGYTAIKHFRAYVEGKRLPHLDWITSPSPSPCTTEAVRQFPHEERHLDFVAQFTIDIRLIRGTNNQAADALSRVSIAMVSASNNPINYYLVRREQQQDTFLSRLLDGDTSLQLEQDLIHSNGLASIETSGSVPAECQRSKIHRHTKSPPQVFLVPDGRFEHVHLDVVGPLPADQGYSYVLTMIDQFTRWSEAIPIMDITATTIAKTFISSWISHHGTSATVTTDRGCQFESKLWRQLMILLGSKRIRTTAYQPSANGMDLQCTAAEMVYGTTIALPVDFLVSSGNQNPGAFGKQLRDRMACIPSCPTRPSRQRDIYLPPDLQDCSDIFVRQPTKPPPLCPPYEGHFLVVKRDRKTITIQRPRGKDNICIDRVQPVHLQEQCRVSKICFATASLEGECYGDHLATSSRTR